MQDIESVLSGIGPAIVADFQPGRILDALPAAVYATDADGRITYFNEAAAEMWGCEPTMGETYWCGSFRLYRPDGTPLPHDQCPMALTLKSGQPVRGVEAILERPDGTRIPFLPFPVPLFDASGMLVGGLNMLVDITERNERRTREAELRAQSSLAERDSMHLAAIVESSDDAIISKDLNGIIVSWNIGAQRLFGYAPEEIVGRSVLTLIPLHLHHEEPGILSRIRNGQRIEHFETVRQHKDGTLIDISLTISPVRDRQGRIVGASKIARDITERKLAAEQRDLLIAELNHRVKNTLATVVAISHQSLSKGRSPEEAHRSFEQRIRTLAMTHSRLAEASWSGVSLEMLLRDETAPYQDRGKIGIAGPDIQLNPKSAVSLGMAFHELATNAAKYGALSSDEGKLEVTWSVTTDRELRIRWHEAGGPAVQAPTRRGFGRLLLERALRSDLDAGVILDFAAAGLRCTITFPLDRSAPPPDQPVAAPIQ
jgi:PAS domain S-box-containing protein